MANSASMVVRFNEVDKQALKEIARRFCGGNQVMTLRLLVRETHAYIKERDAKEQENNQINKQPAN